METLYEILEVSETASSEIIEKAYKVLAKKYHPDLQPESKKAEAEKKMKQINEAYDILGNVQKREEYDAELARKREEKSQVNYNQNNINYNKTNDMQRRRNEEDLRRQEEKLRRQMEENLQQEYENAYYNYLRSLGYKIKEKWTWKRTKDLLITLAILALIFTSLWFIPPTHDMLIEFYESNQIVKIIVDIVVGIVTALFKSIESLFTGGK